MRKFINKFMRNFVIPVILIMYAVQYVKEKISSNNSHPTNNNPIHYNSPSEANVKSSTSYFKCDG